MPALAVPLRARLWLAPLLLLLEYLTLSVCFDSLHIGEHRGLGVFAWIGSAAPALLTAGVALWLFGKQRVSQALAREPELSAGELLRSVTAQLAAFASLGTCTWLMAAGSLRYDTRLALLAWCAALAATLLTAASIVLPLPRVLRLVRAQPQAFALAGVVGAAAWLSGWGSSALWRPLGRATLLTSAWLLALVEPEVYADAEAALLGVGDFVVSIAPECSGYEGIGLLFVFVSAYLFIERARLRMPWALALVPVAIVLSALANAVRIAVLVLVGARVSPEVALGGFHAKAGWVLFCLIAVTLIAVVERTGWLARRPVAEPVRLHNPVASHLMPLVALLGTALVTGLFSAEIDRLYGLRCVAVLVALALFRDARPKLAPSAYGASVLTGALVYLLWIALAPSHESSGTTLRAAVAGLGGYAGPLWLALRVLGSTLFVPVAEELAFRGYLMRRLIAADFVAVPFTRAPAAALLLSALAFGLLHHAYIAGTLAGLAYGLLVVRTGRLGNAVLAHAVTNALIALDVLALGRFNLWS